MSHTRYRLNVKIIMNTIVKNYLIKKYRMIKKCINLLGFRVIHVFMDCIIFFSFLLVILHVKIIKINSKNNQIDVPNTWNFLSKKLMRTIFRTVLCPQNLDNIDNFWKKKITHYSKALFQNSFIFTHSNVPKAIKK